MPILNLTQVAHCEDLSIVPNVCRPTPVLLNATTGDTASDFFSIAVRVPKCENGPVRVSFFQYFKLLNILPTYPINCLENFYS